MPGAPPNLLRVLTLSTLFPDKSCPHLAPFVVRQCRALAALPGVAMKVVAPRGLPPWPLCRHPRYRARAAVPVRDMWEGLDVYRPAFQHWPFLAGRADVRALVDALLPVLRDIRQTFPFDVIDAQYFFPDGPAAVQLGRLLGVPVSIKARGADIHYWGQAGPSGRQVRAAGLDAAGLLAVSAALRDDMVALGLPGARIRVHHTGVDLDRFQPCDRAAAKASLGITGPLIVSVGALIPRKRQKLLIDALAYVPGAHLALVGDGPLARALRRQASRLGVADRITFVGSVDEVAVAHWLAAADVMALPSASEGLANVWLEALASGTPLVVTAAGGIKEVLRNPACGQIVAAHPLALAAAIRHLIKSPPDPADCRALALPFSWSRNAEALRDHLSLLVGK
ncbi:MAG: glycosyltransferase [Chakrabartia sp.]